MPLRDHFHPPLSTRRHWHSFHHAWATCLSFDLNHQLPEGYFAEPNVQFGIEIDVAAFEEANGKSANGRDATSCWTPPDPLLTIPLTLATDIIEVLVYSGEAGPTLAGAIELVSPANKDRPENRDAFISKCATYVQGGVGLAMVDVVTSRSRNLHHDFVARLGERAPRLDSELYAAAYRPVERDKQAKLDIWQEPLAIGRPLPDMPLWLRGGLCLQIHLEETYERTSEEIRIPRNGA